MRLKRLAVASAVALLLSVGAIKFLAPEGALAQDDAAAAILAMMDGVNAQLEAEGTNYRVGIAEYLTSGEDGQIGTTVISKDVGNKQLGHHFVPGDPRRILWSGLTDDITYQVDQVDAAPALPIGVTTAAINRAMATWDGEQCSTIPVTSLANPPFDLGVLENGTFAVLGADVTHAGWVPLPFPILGVTFTFVFIDRTQLPTVVFTDIDNNRKLDTAFREIYYSNAFPWGINTGFPIDVETIALHEAGHGLSQGHFGKIFITNKNSKLHAAPRAVMNAVYLGVQQNLRGTDKGGHCSIWGSWPLN